MTLIAEVEAVAAADQVDADSVRLLAVVPACVTATVRVSPPPVTVTVPARLVLPVFAVALTVKLPLLLPLVGEALSQVWSSVTVQLTFAVTLTADEAAAEANDNEVCDSVRLLAVGAACVTATVRVRPPPVIVTVPVRLVVLVLAVVLTVKLPLFAPLVGDALSHV